MLVNCFSVKLFIENTILFSSKSPRLLPSLGTPLISYSRTGRPARIWQPELPEQAEMGTVWSFWITLHLKRGSLWALINVRGENAKQWDWGPTGDTPKSVTDQRCWFMGKAHFSATLSPSVPIQLSRKGRATKNTTMPSTWLCTAIKDFHLCRTVFFEINPGS